MFFEIEDCPLITLQREDFLGKVGHKTTLAGSRFLQTLKKYKRACSKWVHLGKSCTASGWAQLQTTCFGFLGFLTSSLCCPRQAAKSLWFQQALDGVLWLAVFGLLQGAGVLRNLAKASSQILNHWSWVPCCCTSEKPCPLALPTLPTPLAL